MSGGHGTFYWNELMTRDVERAKKFYGDVIGWSFDAMPMSGGGTYWVAKMNGQPVAGLLDISSPEFAPVSESWVAYIAVDDVDARLERAIQAGAKVMKPVFEVTGVGRIAILMEPGGAMIGWMSPVRPQ